MKMTTKQIIRQLTNIEKLYQPVTPLVINEAKELAKKYQQLQADYESRLKADLKAILDKISVDIDELYSYVEFDEELKTSFNMVRLEEVQRVIDKYQEQKKREKEQTTT